MSAPAPTITVVGQVTILVDTTFQQQYETAAWHKTYKIAAGQVVDLLAAVNQGPSYEGKYRFYANAEGVCTSSNFMSLWGGVPVGKGGIDEHVGDVDQVPVFRGTLRTLAQQLASQDGFEWFGFGGAKAVRIELDAEALQSLDVDIAEAAQAARESDESLKTKDAARQLIALGHIAMVNFNDRRRHCLFVSGEATCTDDLPVELRSNRTNWTADSAKSQYEHTRDGVLGAQQRLLKLAADLKANYGVRVNTI